MDDNTLSLFAGIGALLLLASVTGRLLKWRAGPAPHAVLANLNRAMPKGRILPLPLLCTVSFGTPLTLGLDEGKSAFLARARDALLNLAAEAD